MKSRPILFSAPMVRALLDGSKTQTRRIVKPEGAHHLFAFLDLPGDPTGEWAWCSSSHVVSKHIFCPYGQPGDQLWVRETWQGPLLDCPEHEAQFREDGPEAFQKPGFCAYRATDKLNAIDEEGNDLGWRPSIHMPRWASRITLEVISVRVERLQDISDAGAIAEGVEGHYIEDGWYWRNYCLTDEEAAVSPMLTSAKESFHSLWEHINGVGSWAANPWVWVVEFRRAA